MDYSIFEKKLKNGVNIVAEPNHQLFITYIVAITGVIMCMVLAAFIIQMVLNYKYRKIMLEQTEHKLHISAQIDKTIPELLEYIIQESFRDYEVTTLVPLNEEYINEEREKEIRSELVNIVGERISPVALEKISIFYNEENIARVIADKIYITVMNYVVEHNSKWQADVSKK